MAIKRLKMAHISIVERSFECTECFCSLKMHRIRSNEGRLVPRVSFRCCSFIWLDALFSPINIYCIERDISIYNAVNWIIYIQWKSIIAFDGEKSKYMVCCCRRYWWYIDFYLLETEKEDLYRYLCVCVFLIGVCWES